MFIAGPDYSEMIGVLLEYIAKTQPGARIALVNSDTEFGRDPIAPTESHGGEAEAAHRREDHHAAGLGRRLDRGAEAAPRQSRTTPSSTAMCWRRSPNSCTRPSNLGLKTKFMGTFWSMDNSLWAKVGDPADGFMGVMPYRYYYDQDGRRPRCWPRSSRCGPNTSRPPICRAS